MLFLVLFTLRKNIVSVGHGVWRREDAWETDVRDLYLPERPDPLRLLHIERFDGFVAFQLGAQRLILSPAGQPGADATLHYTRSRSLSE